MLKFLSALALLAGTNAAFAADCSIDIDGTDAMQFSVKEIDIAKTCKDFTINLKHSGALPKAAMGHNVVIAKGADQQGVLADGSSAGLDHDYVKADDARVVAHTKIIGAGESASVTFAPSKLAAGADYVFFCSFPGHAAIMKGAIKLI
ncbi:MAG TPA: azurin [Dokdonella sp.]